MRRTIVIAEYRAIISHLPRSTFQRSVLAKGPMRALMSQRFSKQLSTTLSRLASSSSEAKALSQITGKTPPTPPDSTTTVAGQAFPGDLRSTSGLGFGDNLLDHTSKWMQVNADESKRRARFVVKIHTSSTHSHCRKDSQDRGATRHLLWNMSGEQSLSKFTEQWWHLMEVSCTAPEVA